VTTTDSSAGQTLAATEKTRPLRLPIALALLLVNLVWLLISIEQFLIPREAVSKFDTPADFAERARVSFIDFAGLATLLLPLIAVLLVTHIRPVVAASRLVVVAALAEYAISGLFAVIAFVGAFFYKSTYTDSEGVTTVYYTWRSTVEDGFTRLGSLVLLGVVFLVVLKIALPKGPPKPDRLAAYGRQQAAYPGNGPQAYGQEPYGHDAYGLPVYGPGQPAPQGPPPQGQYPYGQQPGYAPQVSPPLSPPPAQHVSAPPAQPGPQVSGPPAPGQPWQQPPAGPQQGGWQQGPPQPPHRPDGGPHDPPQGWSPQQNPQQNW